MKNEEEINLEEGKFILDWLPDPRLEFEGRFSSEFSFLVSCIRLVNPHMEIYINDDSSNLSGSRASIIGCPTPKSESVICVKGSLERIVPEKDEKINRLEFSITNFTYKYPCTFSLFDKTEIVIKPRNKIEELISELDKKVGRCITHHGAVEFKQGISFDESEKILDSLHYSLGFLSANHVGIVFLKYYFDSEDNPKTVYIHSKPYRNYQNVSKGLIATTNNNAGILNGTRFVANIYEAYKKDEKDAGSILLLVNYYIDSNANNLVTSFILTAACIELLWNWMMVKKLNLFSKKEKKELDNLATKL